MTGLLYIRRTRAPLRIGIFVVVSLVQLSHASAATADYQVNQLGPIQTSGLAGTHSTGSFNPAVSAADTNPYIYLWRRSYYSVRELKASGVRLGIHTRIGVVSAGVSQMGIEGLSNSNLVLSVSRRIGISDSTNSLTGLSLILERFGARDRRRVTRSFLRASVMSNITESMRLAVLLNRSIRSEPEGVRDGGFAVLGLEIDVSETVSAFFDYYKERSMPESIRTGIRIRPGPNIYLGSGIALDPDEFFGQIEIHSGKYLFRIDASRHSYLGWSRSFSLGFLK